MSLKVIKTKHSEATLFRSENLERYLKEISKEEKLTREEELDLLIEAQMGDQRAIEKLTKANLRFVVSCAKEYQKRGFEFPDLIQAGNEGLIEAIGKYDLNQDVRFISYAVWRIKAKIIEFIRNNITLIQLPLNQQNELTRLNKLKEELEAQIKSDLTYSQVIGFREDIPYEYDYIRESVDCAQEFTSMDATSSDNEDYCLAQTYSNKEPLLAEGHLYVEERKRILGSAINTLPDLQQRVLSLSFGLDDGIVRTNEDIAMYLKKTPESIRQIRSKGLKTLKEYKILQELL